MVSLVYGENTYITLAEADELVQELFLTSNTERKFWEALTNEDRTTVILRGTNTFESLLFLGKKEIATQNLSFPRKIGSAVIKVDSYLKKGILEMSILSSINDSNFETKLIEKGVKSYSVEGASISFQDSGKAELREDMGKNMFRKYFSRYAF